LSVKTLPRELSSHLQSATDHKSTQIVAQMLKKPKECLHQQKNEVIYSLGMNHIPVGRWGRPQPDLPLS
jgi:hypothetical protein